MSMNIKNKEAHELAKELSSITGESITTAVTEALREKIHRLQKARPVSLSDQLLAIGKSCAEQIRKSKHKILTDDDLYDHLGLPK